MSLSELGVVSLIDDRNLNAASFDHGCDEFLIGAITFNQGRTVCLESVDV